MSGKLQRYFLYGKDGLYTYPALSKKDDDGDWCDYGNTQNLIDRKNAEIERLTAELAERRRRMEVMREHMRQSDDPLYVQHDMWFIFCRDHCNEASDWFNEGRAK